MNSKISVQEMMSAIYDLEKTQGQKCTLLGIGPMSKSVIEASFRLAKEKDFPLMFIASRNQVDAKELGGGYVCNWDQKGFTDALESIAKETGFDGIYHVCRDHGGPWQRDNERNGGIPEKEAMEIGKQSYLYDMLAGFDLLHIDPTKDPHTKGVIPMETVIQRTVELIGYVEDERKQRGLAPVAYEIGTEETNGGLTGEEAYTQFIQKVTGELEANNLSLPSFIVGQTGTLTRLTQNVGHFDAATAKSLSKNARQFGVGLKEHNADYLSDFILYMHPVLGITAANVAPEFGVAETSAYLLLSDIEKDACQRGYIMEQSCFTKTIEEYAVKSERWRKWMVGEKSNLSIEEVLRDMETTKLITKICGHYTFEIPDVAREKEIMFKNLTRIGLYPQEIVLSRIQKSIDRYVECFNLNGLTSRIKRQLTKSEAAQA